MSLLCGNRAKLCILNAKISHTALQVCGWCRWRSKSPRECVWISFLWVESEMGNATSAPSGILDTCGIQNLTDLRYLTGLKPLCTVHACCCDIKCLPVHIDSKPQCWHERVSGEITCRCGSNNVWKYLVILNLRKYNRLISHFLYKWHYRRGKKNYWGKKKR